MSLGMNSFTNLLIGELVWNHRNDYVLQGSLHIQSVLFLAVICDGNFIMEWWVVEGRGEIYWTANLRFLSAMRWTSFCVLSDWKFNILGVLASDQFW